MAYVFYNPNKNGRRTIDCSVRAISKVLDKDWEEIYIGLCAEGLMYKDMPSSAYVIGMYLRKHGYEQKFIPYICPDCTSVRKFSEQHNKGKFVLVTEEHMVAVVDGDYYDTWDSGDEIVIYYYMEEM